MTADQVWGVIRTILAAFSGYIIAKGWIDDTTYNALLGAVGTIFVTIWSVLAKKPTTPSA